jgi:hypothetical protein
VLEMKGAVLDSVTGGGVIIFEGGMKTSETNRGGKAEASLRKKDD